tara:strand:- start:292 stop:477 length:186 start_codon:yes stop_codon:yes gene_type:complete
MSISQLKVTELSFDELKKVEGGTLPPWFNPISAFIGTSVLLIGASYQAGKAVGAALYNAIN